ncbi:MAG: isoaspartyl peptidase/L-asparaginase [Gammaproteobacteria bacterium]|nr:isoaspartyl peptidase/L-asparaginase [Gammaproteobacteria bacterium]MDE2139578.1 isoaspartyl peptidase/L-asparaginase [Gammaproteobacteria bacterium]
MTLSIIVHGGAGKIDQASMPARLAGCRVAAEAGFAVLKNNGSALDAVQTAVVELENNPLFNAGTGSTLNREGRVETDAAIMDGATLQAGAVAAVSGVRNPVKLARAVMEASPHVLLMGEGAQRFAGQHGVELCDPRELVVPVQRAHWEKEHGTVGAVALDGQGHLAAATSTGGVFDKLAGRVGDSPLIGCGTYADGQAAVSCTGLGEDIIRTTLARHAAYLCEQGMDVAAAARAALAYFTDKTRGEAGLILMDCRGCAGFARNSAHMPVCAISSDANVVTEC